MGGLGPMAWQAAHFRNYKADKIKYAVDRYTNEVIRLYGVMDGRLRTISSLAIFRLPTCVLSRSEVTKPAGRAARFREPSGWFKRVGARPAVERSANIGKDEFRERQKRAQGSI